MRSKKLLISVTVTYISMFNPMLRTFLEQFSMSQLSVVNDIASVSNNCNVLRAIFFVVLEKRAE